MASHWKSTPSYWCKFCETYVRDTPLERKNHESTGKHQGNIQRQLRDIHKRKEREDRDKQRAKDEVARLNGLVGGGDKGNAASTSATPQLLPPPGTRPQPPPPVSNAAAQRKAHAEQLAALGVALPEELKREVTGVGGWSTVSETVVSAPKSLAEIKEEEQMKAEQGVLNKGVHKRKAEDEEAEAEASRKRNVWGSSLRRYPGGGNEDGEGGEGGGEDLNALLSGVGKKKEEEVKAEAEVDVRVKSRDVVEGMPAAGGKTETVDESVAEDVKQESDDTALTAPPAVVFKKRKAKR